jgi:hypothetical protein
MLLNVRRRLQAGGVRRRGFNIDLRGLFATPHAVALRMCREAFMGRVTM